MKKTQTLIFKNGVRLAVAVAAIASMSSVCLADSALFDYVNRPDSTFAWRVASQSETDQGTVYNLELTSQTWQGITWKHGLHIIKPAVLERPDYALLFITGGDNDHVHLQLQPAPNNEEVQIFARVAQAVGSVVCVLSQIPNQPLYDGLEEDALIVYTFDKFLNTLDPTWPLLLPMTKGAVKAMDATQAFAKEKLGLTISSFVVSGGSKRGWTTWLTGAVDPRVKAIAPMVIDVLNMRQQMPHQLESWGAYSEEIEDYTRLHIQERMGTPDGEKLTNIVDPFSYRDRLTIPKLIVLGTNDPYWPVDAVNLYFGQLKGDKHILYVPNAGHGLGSKREALGGLVAFFRQIAAGAGLPRLSWEFKLEATGITLAIAPQTKPVEVNLWTAQSPTTDFRKATWAKSPISADAQGGYTRTADIPQTGYLACYGEVVYPGAPGPTYSLCTNARVFGKQ